MMTGEVLDAMLAAGCSAEQIVAAVKAALKTEKSELEERREADRARKRAQRQREKSTAISTTASAPSRDVRVTSVTPPASLSRPDKETSPLHPPKENNPTLFHLTPISPATPKGVSPPSDKIAMAFDEFWRLYPHKVGKPAAKVAFERAAKRVHWPEMLAGLQRYAAKTDDRPWCNPATWLNQDRWNDEPALSSLPRRRMTALDLAAEELRREIEDDGYFDAQGADHQAVPRLAIVGR